MLLLAGSIESKTFRLHAIVLKTELQLKKKGHDYSVVRLSFSKFDKKNYKY